MLSPFHLAIPVKDLTQTRNFYKNVLACEEGRSSDHWVDFNFFGHQLVIHLSEQESRVIKNHVDGHGVPVPHFGLVLPWDKWEKLASSLQKQGLVFEIEPYIRFKGEVGEQATMFFYDPSGNALEFKAFKNENSLFEK